MAGYTFSEDGAKRIVNAVRRIEGTAVGQPRRSRRQPVSSQAVSLYGLTTHPVIDVEHAGTAESYPYPVATLTDTSDDDGLILDCRFLSGWYDGSTFSGEDSYGSTRMLWTPETFGEAAELEWIGGTVLHAPTLHTVTVTLTEELGELGTALALRHSVELPSTVGPECKVQDIFGLLVTLPVGTLCTATWTGKYDGTPGTSLVADEVLPILYFAMAVCQ